ncbi:hypothetical protein [Tenggerimyces flavus]|uniref:Uncharacterized protein n=1 Tax=Tenggerimyces flavus TaxID=1708749 RepID=A0ABV7YFE0_9ACTN|nr:hypothetical protein [Tenggerimyces flavus]MBM7791386.1 hypothetical protein [Tenggerimyces flavus]
MVWIWILLGVVILLIVGYVVDRRYSVGPWHDRAERDAFGDTQPKGNEQLPPSGPVSL